MKIYMDVKETSEYLNVPINQIYKLCKQKRFPCVKIGKHIRINRYELDKYLYAN